MDTDRNSSDSTSSEVEETTSSSTALHAWVDIFATSKLEFLLNFGFSETQLPIPLSSLFGPTTERSKIVRLEKCMLSGKSFSEFMNLHKSNGGSLSCYVSLLCLTNQQTQPLAAFVTPGLERTLSRDPPCEIVKYGVLTIRSASVVGNSKYSGIGLMGTERVPRERIQEMPGQSSFLSNPSTSLAMDSSLLL